MTVSTWANSWAASWGGSWGWTQHIDTGRRSGIFRLWLMQITSELNGMVERESPKPVEKLVPEVLEVVKENLDGSATVGLEDKPRRTKRVKKPTKVEVQNPVEIVEKFKMKDLPPPEEFASFMFSMMTAEARSHVWAEKKVLEALRQAAEEAEESEEEVLIEAALQFMF